MCRVYHEGPLKMVPLIVVSLTDRLIVDRSNSIYEVTGKKATGLR